ncbi:MAG: hypothetical protein IJE68_02025 [Clostridia bacterium]|nr:hypothetical protein [Clostridia bacterium]
MKAKVILFSGKSDEINNFLNKFYSTKSDHGDSTSWQKEFPNPVEITEFIAAFADNSNSFDLTMWVSLDKDVFIKISPSNSEHIIKYLFERYPY